MSYKISILYKNLLRPLPLRDQTAQTAVSLQSGHQPLDLEHFLLPSPTHLRDGPFPVHCYAHYIFSPPKKQLKAEGPAPHKMASDTCY